MDRKCNSTLEHLRILPATEKVLVGQLTFHDLAIIIAAGSTLIAILLSFFLIMMHATHYTVPRQQKHIIRILFMVPVYASSSFLQIKFHWHAIYFQVISDCYEAFAISSFFSLMCHYIAPDLHEQKEYFRDMHPIKPWVWPINWFRACCCADRGPWRTPRSGLTWFNIIWIGVYHYCFIRVAMTITAVVTQYFDRYCESSNSPFFAHIWVVAIEAIAVTIAMYCLIQFYVQLRNTEQLAPHQPFLKILAIKLVIFLSFWQSMAISVGTSTLSIIQPNEVLAYPDIKIGIPSLLLCFEMACFAVLHLWAFPWRGYNHQANGPRRGGFLGMRALWDAINVWDVVKGFGRGMRWLFVGARHRREDASYSLSGRGKRRGFDDVVDTPYNSHTLAMSETTNSPNPNAQNLPIASQFRSSVWYDRRQQFRQQLGLAPHQAAARENGAGEDGLLRSPSRDESAGLIQNAQTPGSHSPTAPVGVVARSVGKTR
ncbi:organic solute transporter Ostalpha-domain-containing protein [Echria macrotheca]|uniref:Organic solute transporter Ostalpha-domain-containing protein n=1 Tax=Echria macrotheca TaxID=438768 RepID=A0AAJ0BA26_9PEZI|nr:organic solute transporter Ostalpha-domain-containing protein [Echria macrotheca]